MSLKDLIVHMPRKDEIEYVAKELDAMQSLNSPTKETPEQFSYRVAEVALRASRIFKHEQKLKHKRSRP